MPKIQLNSIIHGEMCCTLNAKGTQQKESHGQEWLGLGLMLVRYYTPVAIKDYGKAQQMPLVLTEQYQCRSKRLGENATFIHNVAHEIPVWLNPVFTCWSFGAM